MLASLDHPNIGHIYGIVDSEDSRGLVLALIEGPTLAERIEALEYAHERGAANALALSLGR